MESTGQTRTMPSPAFYARLARSLSVFQASTDKLRVLYSTDHGLCQTEQHRSTQPAAAAASLPSSRDRPPQLLVLDASFNPPTRAHGEMARSAVISAIEERRAAASSPSSPRGKTSDDAKPRLLLLLAVNNADKGPGQPVGFAARLCMMVAFAEDLGQALAQTGHAVAMDVGVTTAAYFHDKAAALVEERIYKGKELEEMEFMAGFDTLVRIFHPKYYKDAAGSATTAMQAALGPFFARARLRVTLRPDDEWGTEEEQRARVRALAGDGEQSLRAVGGDEAWLDRVRLVDGDAAGVGVSSSKIRKLVKEKGVEAAADALYPTVRAWIAQREWYVKDEDGEKL